jgi:hypothetical protein
MRLPRYSGPNLAGTFSKPSLILTLPVRLYTTQEQQRFFGPP